MRNRLILIIINMFVISVFSPGMAADLPFQGKSHDIYYLRDLYLKSMKDVDYDASIRYAQRMLQLTCPDGDADIGREERLMALAYAGQAYIAADKYDSSYIYLSGGLDYLKNTIIDRGDSLADALPIYVLYNSMGIYYINKEMDYDKAADCFIEGLSLSGKYSKGTEYAILVHNLVVSYFILEKTDGLKYALEIYNDGVRRGSSMLKFMGAYGAAMMYTLSRDYTDAEKYISEVIESPEENLDIPGTNNIYARILSETGRSSEAEKHFSIALDHIDAGSATTAVFVYLTYGNFLISQHQYDKSIAYLQKGLDISYSNGNRIFLYRLYYSLAEAYKAKGNPELALQNYEKFHVIKDSIFTISKERAVNELELKYNSAKQEAMLNEYRLQLERKNHIVQWAVMVSIAILVISSILYAMYKNKDRMYMTIVRQYKEAIGNMQGAGKDIAGKETSALSEEKTYTIFNKVQKLMTEDKIFKDPMLTREKVAEMTETNRTYLSKAISEKTGKTFNQYISSLRIAEALAILSDADCRLPLKTVAIDSGFYSQSNFFKLFKEEVGMTPAKYREKIIELSEKQGQRQDLPENEE